MYNASIDFWLTKIRSLQDELSKQYALELKFSPTSLRPDDPLKI
jgi:hypothetical protein